MSNQATVILQARTGSTRLPGKVLADLSGRPLICFLIERLQRCKSVNQIILATTDLPEDDHLYALISSLGLQVVRGSKEDVLSRFVLAAKSTLDTTLIRVTGDCPLSEPEIIDEMVKNFNLLNVDYLSNNNPPSFPDGLDIEVFTKDALFLAQEHCSCKQQREHVTPWIRESGLCTTSAYKNDCDLSAYRWTVDEPEDLIVIRDVVSHFGGKSCFHWKEVLDLFYSKPGLFQLNNMFSRNEGSLIGSGQKLWRRAKRVIPGGNMLLSKRSEMFLPGKWPSYFSKAKGSYVWDLDGNKFLDMCIMGIGTNLLGYGRPEVDEKVLETVGLGNLSTLNCAEEVYLAEKLVDMHEWAQMVRFARTGGEANAIAIRIARASTGRDTVAICGYHGWHDWYLATNLKSESGLTEHLLPGLEPKGVPSSLAGTVQPFSFNRLDQLENIVSNTNLAAVKMEVQRSVPPEPGFLEGVRRICDLNGIVLIFDECTSGFRETFGGLHLKYKVHPDIAMFGKALGNGYAITSVIGKKSIMDAAQSTFISSTFWTERIGPAAALATLEIMEQEKTWIDVTSKGRYLQKRWIDLASKYSLDISLTGIPALSSFIFNSNKHLSYKTLITQEMLKDDILASTSCYISSAHSYQSIDLYLDHLDPIFALISDCENGRSVDELLETPVCHSGFQRLN